MHPFTAVFHIAITTFVSSLLLIVPPASATQYFFSQTGFTGGGTISGSFDAIDADLDGQISSFTGEVTSFSLIFTGDSIVPAFQHSFVNLFGLVYDVGSDAIGDGATGVMEGLASNWNGVAGFDYASGMGPILIQGGRIIEIASGAVSSSDQLIAVTAVPEPATAMLVVTGLAILATARARSRRA